MGSVTKKDHVQKQIWRNLVRSPNRSIIPLWSRRLHIVMEPLAATAGSVGSQDWYFVGDTAGGPLVRAAGVLVRFRVQMLSLLLSVVVGVIRSLLVGWSLSARASE